ncbi:hypothetical protein CCR75_006872 [Bremia lactucae]|uniref:Uncharacterized protein n=1 Tax=Bremia lactucae TaxID=4779 RepID=A0A976IH84_BRELC|nr:hypothetical protein CCR75_006872 [Bremia lactucae]
MMHFFWWREMPREVNIFLQYLQATEAFGAFAGSAFEDSLERKRVTFLELKVDQSKSDFPVRKVFFGGLEAEDLIDENGLLRDGYNYSQDMKEMGQDKFYSATSQLR